MNLSILIATYGDDEWERMARSRALPSALAQDAHEVLIGHEPDGNVATSRNALAAKATGDCLCFLDADDELAPAFHSEMQKAYERESGDGAFCLTPAVSQVRNGRRSRPFFFTPCDFTTGNWVIIGTLITKALYDEVGGFRNFPHGLEDWNLWARVSRAGARFVKVRRAVYVAYWNRDSKHHVLARDRPAYMQAYEAARKDAWGE